jgi:hypothetical protein
MKPIYKIIIAIICLVTGLAYQFYFEDSIVIVDKEITDFLSGILVGIGASILIVSIFKLKKKSLKTLNK